MIITSVVSTLTDVSIATPPLPLLGFLLGSIGVGVGLYLIMGGALYLRYYLLRPKEATRWKCQAERWPSSAMRRYDLKLGLFNITLGSLVSGLLAHAVAAGRFPHGAYVQLSGRNPLLALGSGVAYFFLIDLLLYWAHRIYHRPALFRSIHRFHHRNTTPTPFTAFAMHPIEFLTYESLSVLPLLVLPVYAPVAIAVLLYSHFMALVQHSGIHIRMPLPGVPVSLFHDDHHRHFHVNYGQNLALWDRIFGSLRRHGRRYGVEVFGGQGTPASDAAEFHDFVDYFSPRT